MFAQLFQPCYGVATQKTGYPEMSYSAETEIDGSYHLVLHQAQILTHTHSMIHLPNGRGLKLLTHGCYMSEPSGMTLLRLLVRLSLHTDSSIIMYQHTRMLLNTWDPQTYSCNFHRLSCVYIYNVGKTILNHPPNLHK